MKPHEKDSSRRLLYRSAFTLTELLITVSLIVILIAVILPAFSGVRQKADEARCSSNLRQLGIHVNLYADDHNGSLVPGSIPSPLMTWPTAIVKSQSYFSSTSSKTRDIFYCPATSRKATDNAFKRNVVTWGTDYGGNSNVFPITLSSAPSAKTVKRTSLSAQTILFFDGSGLVTSSTPSHHYPRHFGRVNYLFADNHVESFAKVPTAPQYWSLR